MKTRPIKNEYDSYGQCSAATGIPVSVLRKSKKAGCPAFRHSRVYLMEFIRWHFTQRDKAAAIDVENEKAMLLQAQRKLAEQEVAINDERYVDRAKCETDLIESLRTGRLALVAFAKQLGPEQKAKMESIFKSLRK